MGALERALRFVWSIDEATADEVVRIPQGTVLRTPSLEDAWSANAVRLEQPAPGLTLDEVDAIAAAHVRTPYHYVQVEDERTALQLEAEARAAEGWKAQREVVMGLERPPGEPGKPVREGTLEEVLALMATWLGEEHHPPATLASLIERTRREHTAGPERLLIAEHEGRPAAMCTVRLGGDVAQLEDVFALPDARGTGIGRAVTVEGARLAAASGADVVFILADDYDWPKDLYAKIGFAPLGRRVNLHHATA